MINMVNNVSFGHLVKLVKTNDVGSETGESVIADSSNIVLEEKSGTITPTAGTNIYAGGVFVRYSLESIDVVRANIFDGEDEPATPMV